MPDKLRLCVKSTDSIRTLLLKARKYAQPSGANPGARAEACAENDTLRIEADDDANVNLQVQLEMQHADLTNVIQSIAVAINSSLTTNSLAREEWALEQRKIFNLEVFRHHPQAGPIPDVAPLGEPVFPIDD